MGDLTLGQIDRKPLLNDVAADKEFEELGYTQYQSGVIGHHT